VKKDIFYAIWEEKLDLVKQLILEGIDINVQGHNGFTPLMQAVELENLKIVHYLIESGADTNLPGHQGATPLHIAVDISIEGIENESSSGNELEMISFLLKNGADANKTNSQGESPVDWAKKYNKVIKALESGN